MVSDTDIYRSAWVLVKRHGEDAVIFAAQRADAFLDAGDLGACAAWKRVLAAIKELQRTEARDGEVIQ